MREGRSQVDVLTNQWEMEVRAAPSESEDEEETHFDTSLVPLTSNSGSILKNGNSSPKNRV